MGARATAKPAKPRRPHASLADRARARKAQEIRRAREDVAAFIEYAIPHEKTRRRVTNAAHHLEWQAHLTQCEYAVIIAPVEHGKTQQVVGRIIWELGRDPNLRIGFISNTEGQATKVLNQIRSHIDTNPRIREVFPHLRRSPRRADPWHQTKATVARTSHAKDPSIQALGVYGPIVGSRLDLIVLDDVLDFENTRTAEQRAKLATWFDTEVYTRAQDEPGHGQARIWVIGTPWHPEDILHNLAGRPDFHLLHHCAVVNPDAPERDWEPIWPAVWPLERLLKRRRNTELVQFTRKYLCRVRTDETSRFRESWILQCCRLGRGRTLLPTQPRRPGGVYLPCFTGVDLGVGQKKANGVTSLFTLALDEAARRLVVNIESGKWQGPEIVKRIRSTHRRYNSIVMVESNGAQRYLVQFAQIDASWVLPFNTGGNKWDEEFGIESLAVELENAQWVIPSGSSGRELDPEIAAWVSEMLHYDPELHTGDRLMASWFAREAARRLGKRRRGTVDTQTR